MNRKFRFLSIGRADFQDIIEFPVLNNHDNLLIGINLNSFKKGIGDGSYCAVELAFRFIKKPCKLNLEFREFFYTTVNPCFSSKVNIEEGYYGNYYTITVRMICKNSDKTRSDYQMGKESLGKLAYYTFFSLDLVHNFSDDFIRYIEKFLSEKFSFNGALGFHSCRKDYLSKINKFLCLLDKPLPFFQIDDIVDDRLLRSVILYEQSKNLLTFVNKNYYDINCFFEVSKSLEYICRYMDRNMKILYKSGIVLKENSKIFFSPEIFFSLAQMSYTLGNYEPTNLNENRNNFLYKNNSALQRIYSPKSKYNCILNFLCLYLSHVQKNKIERKNLDFYHEIIWEFANYILARKFNVNSPPKRLIKDIGIERVIRTLSNIDNKRSTKFLYSSFHHFRNHSDLALKLVASKKRESISNEWIRSGCDFSFYIPPSFLPHMYKEKLSCANPGTTFPGFSTNSQPHPKIDDPFLFGMTGFKKSKALRGDFGDDFENDFENEKDFENENDFEMDMQGVESMSPIKEGTSRGGFEPRRTTMEISEIIDDDEMNIEEEMFIDEKVTHRVCQIRKKECRSYVQGLFLYEDEEKNENNRHSISNYEGDESMGDFCKNPFAKRRPQPFLNYRQQRGNFIVNPVLIASPAFNRFTRNMQNRIPTGNFILTPENNSKKIPKNSQVKRPPPRF